MTTINEPAEEVRFIVNLLKGDSTLTTHAPGGIHLGAVPKVPVKKPWIIISQQNPGTGDVVAANPSVRVMHNGLWLVKVVGPEELLNTKIMPAWNDIERLMQTANGFTSTANIQACYRAGALYEPEILNGIRYLHVGGVWELQTTPL